MKNYRFLKMVRIALFGALAITLVNFVVMSLWNVLMPAIFALHAITFWQSLGLLLLCKILFGGFRAPGGGPGWRRRMFQRWEQMTPEEREQFKQGLRRGCGARTGVEVEA